MLVQAQPFLSYGVLIVNLAVYAAGLGLRFSLGESSGEDYFYMLAKVNDEVVQGEYYRCCSLDLPHHQLVRLESTCTRAVNTVADAVALGVCISNVAVASPEPCTDSAESGVVGADLTALVLAGGAPDRPKCSHETMPDWVIYFMGKRRDCDLSNLATWPRLIDPCSISLGSLKNEQESYWQNYGHHNQKPWAQRGTNHTICAASGEKQYCNKNMTHHSTTAV